MDFNKGVVIKIGHFNVTVKQVHNWYCVYIRVPYVEGCKDIGTYCEMVNNNECIIGEDTAKSWLNYTDFASVYIMANALIENYCELRDNDYKRLLTMVTGE